MRNICALFAACVLAVAAPLAAPAQEPAPLGIGLEGYAYPYPVAFLLLVNDGTPVQMAYMDVAPRTAPNGATVLLLHGKNFGGYYFGT